VPGLGELFVRDTGGPGPPALLLHGWMFPSDLNWWRTYQPLAEAGHRVLALDHRGHGRGLRPDEPFTLASCAADAAALVRELGCGPVIAVGYSMGGPIAALMARDHPDTVAGLVLCATAAEWREPRMRTLWSGMGLLRLFLSLFPRQAWRLGLRWTGFPDSPVTSWVAAELSRGSGRDIAEAGRELGRFDGRAWIGRISAPAAVVVTTADTAVPPRKQRELAELLSAPTFEVSCDHAGVIVRADEFAAALLRALRSVSGRGRERASAA
jgi:3-oxoadipate enol-lactonase